MEADGSYVLAVQRLEVVDGQQRLTTLPLLFAALYQSLKLHEKDLDDDQRVELINLERKLVLKKGDDQYASSRRFRTTTRTTTAPSCPTWA